MSMMLNRREAMVLGAAAVAAGTVTGRAGGQTTSAALVERHDASLKGTLAKQVTDPQSRWRGAYPNEYRLYYPHSAGQVLYEGVAAYLHPQSTYHQSAELFDRIKLAAGFLEREQTPDGNIDLIETNFNSPPDTGFVVHRVATAARLAQVHGDDVLLKVIKPFLVKAGEGMAKGGIHTPNHRWVVSSALAQINEVFPDPRYIDRIDQWLAEGVDIDEEGQYIERSTTVYNATCNNAFVTMALKLNRPELLEPVRRNLDAMMYLVHPNGDVVTETSRRQDLNRRGTMERYWFALRYMAIRDKNGRYATMLAPLEPGEISLATWMEYPEIQGDLPKPKPLPDNFEQSYPIADITRIRQGKTSATIMHKRNSRCFTVHHGEAVIQGVRYASAFFGDGQFVPTEFEKRGDTFVFRQEVGGRYLQPTSDPKVIPVTRKNWGMAVSKRDKTEICTLTQELKLRRTEKGFEVAISATGTDNVPLAVEISLRPGGELTGVVPARHAESHLLKDGFAVYRVGSDTIRFGPGHAEHAYTQVRGADGKLPGTSVYLTGYTPFQHTLLIELE